VRESHSPLATSGCSIQARGKFAVRKIIKPGDVFAASTTGSLQRKGERLPCARVRDNPEGILAYSNQSAAFAAAQEAEAPRQGDQLNLHDAICCLYHKSAKIELNLGNLALGSKATFNLKAQTRLARRRSALAYAIFETACIGATVSGAIGANGNCARNAWLFRGKKNPHAISISSGDDCHERHFTL